MWVLFVLTWANSNMMTLLVNKEGGLVSRKHASGEGKCNNAWTDRWDLSLSPIWGKPCPNIEHAADLKLESKHRPRLFCFIQVMEESSTDLQQINLYRLKRSSESVLPAYQIALQVMFDLLQSAKMQGSQAYEHQTSGPSTGQPAPVYHSTSTMRGKHSAQSAVKITFGKDSSSCICWG